jgi:hypothetical protein
VLHLKLCVRFTVLEVVFERQNKEHGLEVRLVPVVPLISWVTLSQNLASLYLFSFEALGFELRASHLLPLTT